MSDILTGTMGDPAHALPWLALAAWIVLTIIHAGAMALAMAQPVLARRDRRLRADRPHISCLLPVSAEEHAFARCFESLRRQDYPSFDFIACSDREDSPGLLAAKRLAGDETQFAVARERLFPNPKINNLQAAIDQASGPLILIKDSSIETPPGALAEMARRLGEGVGLVCALPVACRPASPAAWVELANMNGRDAPFTAAAVALGMTVGYGKIMLLRKDDLMQIGGLARIGFCFGDDHALALALEEIGLRTVYVEHPVFQPLGQRSWSSVIERQVRWMVIRRDQAPLAFWSEPLLTSPLYLAVAALAAPVLGWSAGLCALAAFGLRMGAEGAAMAALGWMQGWRYVPAALLRDAAAWLIWLRALRAREIQWAGQRHASGAESAPR